MRVLNCFLLSILFTFCESGSIPCTDCSLRQSDLSAEQVKQLRHEYLKNQILKKLHLKEPPKINSPKPPLNSLLAMAEIAEKETTSEFGNQQKTERVVIFPKNESLACSELESYFCYRFEFNIPESLRLENFLSAEIWIPNNDAKVFRAYQIREDSSKNTTSTYELEISAKGKISSSWSQYNAVNNNFWSNNSSENVLVIEVMEDEPETYTGSTAWDKDETPFLVIESEVVDIKGRSTRQKRSSSCTGNSTSCCKEDFYLKFREVGWDDWILHPDGYQANFCRGSCFNDLSKTHFYHSTVLLNFIDDNKNIAEEMGLSMCCTPSLMAPLTIFFRNEEGLIVQKSIANMRVEACDCA